MTRSTSPEFADHIGRILTMLSTVDDMARNDIDLPNVDHQVTNTLISRMVRNNQLQITQYGYTPGQSGRVAITDLGRNALLDWRQTNYLRANADRIVPPQRIDKLSGTYVAPRWGRGVGTNCALPGTTA